MQRLGLTLMPFSSPKTFNANYANRRMARIKLKQFFTQ